MPGRIFRVTALLFYVLAGPVAPAWAQQEKAVTWLGLDWVYRSFDNGLGMAGYTLTAEDLSALSAGGASGTREARTREACNRQAAALFSRIDGLADSQRDGGVLTIKSSITQSFKLEGYIDLDATIVVPDQAADCSARITVFHSSDLPRG